MSREFTLVTNDKPPALERVTMNDAGSEVLGRERLGTVTEAGPWTDTKKRCPRCGSTTLHARMLRVTEGHKTVPETECTTCGFHEVQHERGVKRDWSERAR